MSELLEFRSQIDQIDHQIIELLAKRFEIVKQVGHYKKEHHIAPLQVNRWNEVLKNRIEIAQKYNIDPNCIVDIWNRIHESALEMEKNLLN
ncbi:chorismate mutase [Candidatus Gracilibacteria bacterium]|nr:chorismate mutase [Candidatus Gracilibacteria bacterium]